MDYSCDRSVDLLSQFDRKLTSGMGVISDVVVKQFIVPVDDKVKAIVTRGAKVGMHGPLLDVSFIKHTAHGAAGERCRVNDEYPDHRPPWSECRLGWIDEDETGEFPVIVTVKHNKDGDERLGCTQMLEYFAFSPWTSGRLRGQPCLRELAIIPLSSEGHIMEEGVQCVASGAGEATFLAIIAHAFSFANAANVFLVDAPASRSTKRRLMRAGTEVKILAMTRSGIGKRRKSTRTTDEEESFIPLTTVKGHWKHYGPEYNRKCHISRPGQSFKFWVEDFARGDAKYGTGKQIHILNPPGGSR